MSTALTTPSATRRRTSRIALFSRVGCTRFVSRMIKSSRVGSIQTEVPVNPVWPNEVGESKLPAELPFEGVSQPNARLLPSGKVLPGSELLQSAAPHNPAMVVDSTVQQHLAKDGEITRVPEEPGVG